MRSLIEYCKNPFRKRNKRHKDDTNIALYIMYNNIKYPICYSCWNKIGNSDKEWSQ